MRSSIGLRYCAATTGDTAARDRPLYSRCPRVVPGRFPPPAEADRAATEENHYVTMIEPPIGSLLEKTESRFGLVVLSARRARQINAYFNQLGEGLGSYVPPQVHSLSRKPLSIALEEIENDKVVIQADE